MKIIFCLIIITVSILIGINIIDKKKKSKSLYFELLNFIDYLKININFSQKKLILLLEDYISKYSENFSDYIKQYILKFEDETFIVDNLYFLNKHQNRELNCFFNELGTLNNEGQMLSLERYREIFKKESFDAKVLYEKHCKLTIKICLAIGLVLCVLII